MDFYRHIYKIGHNHLKTTTTPTKPLHLQTPYPPSHPPPSPRQPQHPKTLQVDTLTLLHLPPLTTVAKNRPGQYAW